MPDYYKLEATLEGHEQDVRAVAVLSNDLVLTAARDKTVRSWQRTGVNRFSPHNVFYGHDQSVNAIAAIPATDAHPTGLFASGGFDKLIHIYEPFTPSAPVYTLVGHTENVCALAVAENGDIVSGSWDKTAIVWKNFQQAYTLTGHTLNVWAVLPLDDDRVLTGSADKTIRLWKHGKEIKKFEGHTDAVRDLAVLPGVGFVSCANDASVRVWSLDGQCLQELYGHTAYVYSVAVLSTGEIVSCGEDRTARVWKDGECIQTLQQPCISVWSVAALPNDDIVVGGSDAVARVYTRDLERSADPEDIKLLDDLLANQAIPAAQVGDVDKNSLPGPEALDQPGSKEGQVIMVNINGAIEAYQWESANRTWQKLGTVVGGVGSGQKQMYQGQEYDFVFDVDIGSGPSGQFKLPYNLNQNPYDAAQKFLLDNELSPMYVDQIVDFITKNTQGVSIGQPSTQYQDPFTGGSRYTPSQGSATGASSGFMDPYTGSGGYHGTSSSSQHAPASLTPTQKARADIRKVLPLINYLSLKQANLDALHGKLKSLNGEQAAENQFGDAEWLMIQRLMDYLREPHSDDIPEEGLELLLKSCQAWTPETRFPLLDLLRLVALYAPEPLMSAIPNGRVIDFVTISSCIIDAASQFQISKAMETNGMLGYRALANLFNHEIGRKGIGPQLPQLLSALQTDIVLKYKGKSTKLAISTLTLNLAVYLTTVARDEDSEISLTGSILELIKQETDEENLYRLLTALGTVLTYSEPCIEMANLLEIKMQLNRLQHQTADRERMQAIIRKYIKKKAGH
ncbi:WD40-repeat-containing domain protein [Gongronella butleri]|nr:WD40-repeat-containing domain protein [Gongronella butleri]